MKNADPLLVGTIVADLGVEQSSLLTLFTAKVMRHLAAVSDVREVGSDQYVHSKYSRGLSSNPLVDAFKYMYVHNASSATLSDVLGTDALQFR